MIALDILQQWQWDGVVCVPERDDWEALENYEDQVEWEFHYLSACSQIMFWIPRELDLLPGFTTNVEFGFWISKSPERVFYGRPSSAPKTRYLDWLYHKTTGRRPLDRLEDLLRPCVRDRG